MCTASPPRRISRPLARVLPLVLAALLLTLVVPQPASAVSQDSIGEIVKRLEESPVYVDSGYRAEVPASRQRALESRIEDSGINIRIVLVTFDAADRWNGDAEQFAGALRDRMDVPAGEHLILLTPNSWYGESLRGFEWPEGSRYQATYAALAMQVRHREKSIPLAEQLGRAIEMIEAGTSEQEYRKAREDNPLPGGSDDAGLTPWLIASLVLALAGTGALLVRRRGRGTSRTNKPYALRSHVFVAAREADEDTVRRQAQREVLRLGDELRTHQSTAEEHTDPAPLRMALDAYDAAGRVLDGAVGLPDLVGALALVSEGDEALAADDRARATRGGKSRTASRKRTPPLPLCFFHPLHGRAVTRINWRALGRREALDVATCRECANAVKHRRAPRALTDWYDGQEVPYFDVPAEQSLWTATGYGSFGDEPLATRVQRGDFTRAAEARARAKSR